MVSLICRLCILLCRSNPTTSIGELNLPAFHSFVLSAHCLLVSVLVSMPLLAIMERQPTLRSLIVYGFVFAYIWVISAVLVSWVASYCGLLQACGCGNDDADLDPRMRPGKAPRRKLRVCGRPLPGLSLPVSQVQQRWHEQRWW